MNKDRVDIFTDDLSDRLRMRFRTLAAQLNGDGPASATQITNCTLACAAEAQRYSPDYLEEYEFMEIIEPLREHPLLGESMRPFYDACCAH